MINHLFSRFQLRHAAFVLAGLVALFFTGCINYEETVTLNANGSGTMVMHYSLAQQLVTMMSMGGQEQGGGDQKQKDIPFKLKEDEVRADLNVKGVKVDKFETKTEGDQQHFYVTLSFENITDLNASKTFKEMPFEWTEKDGKITFKQTLKGKKEGKTGDAAAGGNDEMGKQMAKAMFGNAAFTYKITLPSKALPAPDTNGTIDKDGKTVTWTHPLADLGETDKVMTATFKKGGFPLMLIGIIGGVAVISLIALILVVAFARKK